jgi:hypothetical protein|tara:strand:+ start:257 stop:622 length:366 start_codon:yes stop_codon:yes gene_type:complete
MSLNSKFNAISNSEGGKVAIAATLLWLAALSSFCASKQQSLLAKPLSKLTGWGLCTLLFFLAWLFMLGTYAALSAFFLGITYVMGAWIAMVFILGHYNPGLLQFGSGGIVVSVALLMLGGL